MAGRSKARVYGRSFAGTAVLNSAGGMEFVSCECCTSSGRGLCDGPIARPEESYRLWHVIVCDLLISSMRRPWPALGCCARNKKKNRLFAFRS